jgi:atypical dual specificity phosphatase
MKITWIEDGFLAASGIPLGVKDLESLYEQGIRAIVTLTEHPLILQREITLNVLTEIGLLNIHAPVQDYHPPDVATVERVTEFVERRRAAQEPVLVHCHAGIGRTGTMLHAYYLMQGMSLAAAQAKVKATKPTSQFIMLSASQRAFLEDLANTVHKQE